MSLSLQNLRKNYVAPDGSAVPVIDIDDLSLADGEQVALIGTSGSGKTTLLHMIAGILAADAGEILFGTVDPAYRPQPAENVVGYRRHGPPDRADGAVDIVRLTEAQRDVFRGQNIG